MIFRNFSNLQNLTTDPIAIFAGRGSLPKLLIEECKKRNQKFSLFLLESEKYDIDYSAENPITVPFGAIEKFLSILSERKIKNLVFVGSINKPNFSSIKTDKTGAILLAKLIAKKLLGDDAVLRTVMDFFTKRGLQLVPIHLLLDCVISEKCVLTKIEPSQNDLEDIALGAEAIKYFSKFDLGQAVVISQKQIIAVEALEGTDEMIKRCKNFSMRENLILVKMKKRGQSKKADLPAIGIDTIKNCSEARIKGIAIEAGSTLVLEKEKVLELADDLGLFLIVI